MKLVDNHKTVYIYTQGLPPLCCEFPWGSLREGGRGRKSLRGGPGNPEPKNLMGEGGIAIFPEETNHA